MNFRNNFIFYVCVLGVVIAYISFLWAGRIMDKDKVNQQFNINRRFDTGEMDKKMDMLEKWSDIVDVLTSSKSEAEKQEARQSLDGVLYFMRFGHERSTEGEKKSATDQKGRHDKSDTPVKALDAPQP